MTIGSLEILFDTSVMMLVTRPVSSLMEFTKPALMRSFKITLSPVRRALA